MLLNPMMISSYVSYQRFIDAIQLIYILIKCACDAQLLKPSKYQIETNKHRPINLLNDKIASSYIYININQHYFDCDQ